MNGATYSPRMIHVARCQTEAPTRMAPNGSRKNHAITSREKATSSRRNPTTTHSKPISPMVPAQTADVFMARMIAKAVAS